MTGVLVGKLAKLRPHPSLPHLCVGEVAGKTVVVGDHYVEGVPGVFFPDGAILTEQLIKEMWLEGRLAGKAKNRVKARDRGGVFSEGVFYGSQFWEIEESGQKKWFIGESWNPSWLEGDDVGEQLGVTLWKGR